MQSPLRRLPRAFRVTLRVLAIAAVLEYIVLPQIAGARKALDLVARVQPGWLAAGVLLEGAAIVAYAQLTRSVLPETHAPPLWPLVRVQMSTLAVSHVVPGGTAAGTPLGYRLLRGIGVAPADAGFALATQGIGSAAVLNVLLWAGLIVSIPVNGYDAAYTTAAIAGAFVIGALAAAVVALTRGERRTTRVLRAVFRPIPFLDEDQATALVARLAERLRALGADPARLRRSLGWAAANWLLDAASLWVFVAAFGHYVSPPGLIVAFGLAYVLAAIPLTPGGLGVVEAVLTATLVGFGTPRGEAILGVVSYRLVNFWLPIPLGAAAYVSLRVEEVRAPDEEEAEQVVEEPEPVEEPGRPEAAESRPGEERGERLRHLAEEAVDDAEDLRAWARRHALRRRP